MASHRQRRVAELIQKELADLLQREIQDPRLSQVSITGVDVSPDLELARVYFSVMDDEMNVRAISAAFEGASGFLRKELASRMSLRHVPRLAFSYDNSLLEGSRIEKLLRQIAVDDDHKGSNE